MGQTIRNPFTVTPTVVTAVTSNSAATPQLHCLGKQASEASSIFWPGQHQGALLFCLSTDGSYVRCTNGSFLAGETIKGQTLLASKILMDKDVAHSAQLDACYLSSMKILPTKSRNLVEYSMGSTAEIEEGSA